MRVVDAVEEHASRAAAVVEPEADGAMAVCSLGEGASQSVCIETQSESGAFAAAGQGPAAVRSWHVLHTRSRQEKAVCRLLEAAGVDHYLPLVERRRRWGGRQRRVSAPLFPGYVFVRAAVESLYVALDSGRVVRRVPVEDQQRLARELAHIQQAMRYEGSFDPYPYLRRGLPVRVRSGPLKGVEGLVDARKSWDRLILQIHALGRAVSLEIDADLLDPVG